MTEFFLVLAGLIACCAVIAALSLMVGLRELVDQQTRQAVALEAIAEAAGSFLDATLARAEADALRVLEDSRKTNPGEVLTEAEEVELAEEINRLHHKTAHCFQCGKIREVCRCSKATLSSTKG
jgi:hypothetical protein